MNSLGNFDVNKSGSSPENPQMGSLSDKQLNQETVSQLKGSRMQKAFASTAISAPEISNPNNASEKKAQGRSVFVQVWAHLPDNPARAGKAASRAAANQVEDALHKVLKLFELSDEQV